LIPAAATAIAVFTGGVTLPVVIGVYALTDLLQELLEIAWEAAEANLINWMFSHKQDIVCELYDAIQAGGTGTEVWQPVADNVVEPSGDLSNGDKVLVNFWFGIIGNYVARIAQTENSPWYQSVPEAGYCAVCPLPENVFYWEFPPCPGEWGWGDFVCWNDRLCGRHGKYANNDVDNLDPPPGGWTKFTYELKWTSVKPASWGVGTVNCFYWDGDSHEPIHGGVTFSNTVDYPGLNETTVEVTSFSAPNQAVDLFQFLGQAAQYETEPYPLMIHSVRVTCE
jgi:hypothetical protein